MNETTIVGGLIIDCCFWHSLIIFLVLITGCGVINDEAFIVDVNPPEKSKILEGSTIIVKFNRVPYDLEVMGESSWEQDGKVVTIIAPYFPSVHSIYYTTNTEMPQIIVLDWPTGRKKLTFTLKKDESLYQGLRF